MSPEKHPEEDDSDIFQDSEDSVSEEVGEEVQEQDGFAVQEVESESISSSSQLSPETVSVIPSDEEVKPFRSDKILIISVICVILALLAVIFVPKLLQKTPMSIDELHAQNFAGKLNKNEGYIYNAHSFVKFDNLWYVSLINPSGTKQYNMPFHYGPREVEDIVPEGEANFTLFQETKNIFITFDPTDDDLNYIGVAVGEVDGVLINGFGKGVIPSCTKNETLACASRPKVDCSNKDVPIIYFASENKTSVIYLNNCIIVSGSGTELFRAADRMLFNFLSIQ